VAQLIGIATLVGFVFTLSYVINWVLDIFIGHRVSVATEVAGLDLPEMGQLGYPEFVFRAEPDVLVAAEKMAVA
jgi:Amt family ammonium transporter